MSNKPFIPSFDDIVFEHRNKAYGAYVIRKRKERTALIAFVAGLILVMAIIKLPYLIMGALDGMKTEEKTTVVTELEMDDKLPPPVKEVEEVKPIAPPPPPPPPPPTVSDVARTTLAGEPEIKDNPDPEAQLDQDKLKNVGDAKAPEYVPTTETGNGDPAPVETVDMSAVEEKPLFSGDLNKFLSSNLNYPEECVEGGIQGRVIVEFVVGTDGKITDVSVKRGVHALLDREAMRVVKSMPAWTPGRQGGKAVPVRYRQPITFQLGG